MKMCKPIISITVALSIVISAFSFLGVGASAKNNLVGDANSDGAINSFDALMITRYVTEIVSLSPAEEKAADVDGNGAINSTDALLVLHYAIGRIEKFPASPESSGRVEIIEGWGFYYDPATGKVVDDKGQGLLGFGYDAQENCFYSTNNAWQRNFGYTYIYDYAAPFTLMNFDTSRIFFKYNGMDWMVQLWKGQYGMILIGCEIGLYYRDFSDDILVDNKGRKVFKCADDEMLIRMSLGFYRDNKLIFSRREQYSWWLTGFYLSTLPRLGVDPETTATLMVDAKLSFDNEEMMDAFIEGLKNTTEIEHNASKKIRKISFVQDKTYFVNRHDLSVSFNWQ